MKHEHLAQIIKIKFLSLTNPLISQPYNQTLIIGKGTSDETLVGRLFLRVSSKRNVETGLRPVSTTT